MAAAKELFTVYDFAKTTITELSGNLKVSNTTLY